MSTDEPSNPNRNPSVGTLQPSSSQSHSFQSFGEYSNFLRLAVADEESLQVGESLQVLAVQIESLVAMLQQRGREPQPLSLALINLVGDLRTHRALLLGLGSDWHSNYEFDAHFAALNHFRILVTQWALEAAPPRNSAPALADFDLARHRQRRFCADLKLAADLGLFDQRMQLIHAVQASDADAIASSQMQPRRQLVHGRHLVDLQTLHAEPINLQ